MYKRCEAFSCLFPLDAQNEIQMLARFLSYSWLVCLLVFWLRNAQLVKVIGNLISDGSLFLTSLCLMRICVRGTRTQPLSCVGFSVHYWVSCAICKGGFFEIAFSSSTHICLRFASLGRANSTCGDSCVLGVHLSKVC